MIIKRLQDCPEFISGDIAVLRELLHADKGELSLGYSLAHAIVKVGKRTKSHRLIKSSEVYYIIAGKGRMYINDESSEVSVGSVIYIPPNARQYIENIGTTDLVFLCIVDPAWQPQDEEILEK